MHLCQYVNLKQYDCLVNNLSNQHAKNIQVPPSCEAQGRSDVQLSHDTKPTTPSILQVIALCFKSVITAPAVWSVPSVPLSSNHGRIKDLRGPWEEDICWPPCGPPLMAPWAVCMNFDIHKFPFNPGSTLSVSPTKTCSSAEGINLRIWCGSSCGWFT